MKLSDLKSYKVVGVPNSLPQVTQPKTLGQKVTGLATGISNFVGAQGITEQFGADLARASVPEEQKNLITYPSAKKVIGSAIQTGANLLPGVGAGANLATKVAVGAGTGYAFDVGSQLQSGKEKPGTPGIGTAVGAGLPLAAAVVKPAARFVGRLFKGIGSGLSGVSTGNIDTILNNPQEAVKASQELARTGNSAVLEKNARQIVEGVSKVRNEARKAFGTGLEQLSKTDIDPSVFRGQTQQVLEKYGSALQNGERVLQNVEFNDPKNLAKASDLIDKLSTVELDGRSLRKLADDIENTAYKVATSDERLSFNAFLNDLSSSLRGAVSQSTDKLDEINRAFSQDMQLTEAVQQIFGKVNYKNLPELVRASKRLETLFNQNGLAPDVIDNFLTRIGASPQNFRTSEAVRQIGQKTSGGNQIGLSIGELTREVTSAIVTPNMVKNIATYTGLTEQVVKPFLEGLKPTLRNIVIQALLQAQGSSK